MLPYPKAEHLATLARLRAEGHPWVAEMERYADAPLPETWSWPDHPFDYLPLIGAVLYAGGDEARGRVACETWLAIPTHPPQSRNFTREKLIFMALSYQLLLPIMTAEERDHAAEMLRNWCQWCVDGSNGGTRIGDSDEEVGHYFGVRCTDLVLGTSYAQTPTMLAVEAAVRAGVVACTPGGAWRESSAYNLGTEQLLLCGAHLAGIEDWPEVAALAQSLANYHRFEVTPDHLDSAQWGDVEGGQRRWLMPDVRHALLCALIQFGYDPDGQTRAAMKDLETRHAFWQWRYLIWRSLLLGIDPAVGAAALTEPSGLLYSPFVGVVLHRTADSLVMVHGAHQTGEDHAQGVSDLRIWKGTGWTFDSRIGTIGRPVDAHNTPLLWGLSAMYDRGFATVEETATGLRTVWQTAGSYYPPGHWLRPNSVVETFFRTVDVDVETGATVISDTGTVIPPDLAENWTEPARTLVQNSPPYSAVFHCDSEPMLTDASWTWTDARGVAKVLTPTGIDPALTVKRPTNLPSVSPEEQAGKWQLVFASNSLSVAATYSVVDSGVPVPPPPVVPPPPPPPVVPPVVPPPPPPATWQAIEESRATESVETPITDTFRKVTVTSSVYERLTTQTS